MIVSTQEKRAAVCHEKSTVELYRSALQMRESPDGWGVGDLEEKLRFLVRCSGWGLGVCVVGMCVLGMSDILPTEKAEIHSFPPCSSHWITSAGISAPTV